MIKSNGQFVMFLQFTNIWMSFINSTISIQWYWWSPFTFFLRFNLMFWLGPQSIRQSPKENFLRMTSSDATIIAIDPPEKMKDTGFFSFLKDKKLMKKILPQTLMMFFILFNYTILRDTKDVLVVTAPKSGAEIIPFLKTYVQLPAAIAFTFLYSILSNRMPQEQVFKAVITTFLAFFGSFAAFIYPNRGLLHPNNWADRVSLTAPTFILPMVAIIRYVPYGTILYCTALLCTMHAVCKCLWSHFPFFALLLLLIDRNAVIWYFPSFPSCSHLFISFFYVSAFFFLPQFYPLCSLSMTHSSIFVFPSPLRLYIFATPLPSTLLVPPCRCLFTGTGPSHYSIWWLSCGDLLLSPCCSGGEYSLVKLKYAWAKCVEV